MITKKTLLSIQITYSMEQSPWETKRFSASQENPRISRKPKVRHHIHKCSPQVIEYKICIFKIYLQLLSETFLILGLRVK